MHIVANLVRWPTIGLVLIAFGACAPKRSSAPPAPDQDEIEYELHPWVTELSSEALTTLVEKDDARGLLRFTSAPEIVRSLAKGSVVVAGKSSTTPRGFLRVVVTAEQLGDDTLLSTLPIPLPLAFRSLHATLRREPVNVASATGVTRTGLRPQVVFGTSHVEGNKRVFDAVPFNLDRDLETKDDQLVVHADIEGQVGYTATIDLDWLGDDNLLGQAQACIEDVVSDPTSIFDDCVPIPDVKIGFEASLSGRALLEVEGASARAYASPTILLNDEPWQLPELVAGPVVLTPELDFTAEVSGDAATFFRIHTDFGFELAVSTSAGVKSGIKPPKPTFEKMILKPEVTVSSTGRSKATFGPRLSLLAYDTFGFYTDLHAFGALDADRDRTPCWDYEVGIETSPGVRLRIPWHAFGLESLGKKLGLAGDIVSGKFGTFTLYSEHPFASASDEERACALPPISALPLGEGPTSETYQDPQFVPWSYRLGNIGATQPNVAHPGQSRLLIEKAHDSSWIVSGAFLGSVSKITDDGEVAWARSIEIGRLEDEDTRALPTSATSVLAATSPMFDHFAASDRLTLLALDPSGDVRWARRLRASTGLPEDLWQLAPVALASLPGGHFAILYSHRTVAGSGPVLLLRVTQRGGIVFARRIEFTTGDVSIGAALVPVGDDVVVAGFGFTPSTTESFLMRFDPSGNLLWSRDARACEATRTRIEALTLRASGDLALLATHRLSPERTLFATLSPEGAVRNSLAFWTGSALEDVNAVALAELPTSGFVTLSMWTPNALGHTFELGTHDALGGRTTGVGYGLSHENTMDLANLRPAGLRLTTDGGALLGAHVALDQVFDDHGLWLSKVPARSFEAPFDPNRVRAGKGDMVDETCELVTSPASVSVSAVTLVEQDVGALVRALPTNVTRESRLVP